MSRESLVKTESTTGLNGQVAMITGGGQGIGRAMAHAFAGSGAIVAIADVQAEHASAAAEAIRTEGGHALAFPTDVTSPESVSDLFAAVRQQFARLDILVNNAGMCPVTPFPDFTLAS